MYGVGGNLPALTNKHWFKTLNKKPNAQPLLVRGWAQKIKQPLNRAVFIIRSHKAQAICLPVIIGYNMAMSNEQAAMPPVFSESYDFEADVRRTASQGYAFASGVFTADICRLMEAEVASLPMEFGDHVKAPINQGKPFQVQQSHERYYDELSSGNVPVAKFVAEALHSRALNLTNEYPELADWSLNEAGYQNYRNNSDMIGVHRDRRNDQLLAVTITITGSAQVLIHEPLGDPDDYRQTRITDQFRTTAGSVMMLRATGLASGEQTLHQVMPPEHGNRLILNLRMRPPVDESGTPKILEQPHSK